MATNKEMEYCKNCDEDTLHIYPATSHIIHLILSLITYGIWVIVWIIIHQNNGTKSQCTKCGANVGVFGITTGGNKSGPSPDTHLKCPDCRELVLKDARVCKHCGLRLKPQ